MEKSINQKHILVSVINDLATDNRVHKVCTTLTEMGFAVTLVGRKLPGSLPLNERPYSTIRMRLIFNKGALFYAEYNLRLFFLLFFSGFDILLSNDLDTLLANLAAAKIKNKPLVFDSHEYFTGVPELINRPRTRRTWKGIEKKIIPQLKYAYTVCDSIARLYYEEYGVRFSVVRNVPKRRGELTTPNEGGLGIRGKIVLYQGALNIGRGLPQVIEAMQYVNDATLVIAGDGDITSELKTLVGKLSLNGKVRFTGRLPMEKVKHLTAQAHLGLSIEEDLGLNYRYALPNKLFDYIQAKVPVLVTNLPEMAKIVNGYQIGLVTDTLEPKKLAEIINSALTDNALRKTWETNLEKASEELTWENEENIIQDIFKGL